MPKTTTFHSDPAMPEALWSAGLPFCSQRPLTADERRRVERLQRRLQVEGVLCFGAGPALFLISVGVWLRDPQAESSWQFLAIGLFLGLLILGLMFSPGGWLLLREARTLKAALQLGIVDRFGSPAGEEPLPDEPGTRQLATASGGSKAPAESSSLPEQAAREEFLRRVEMELGGSQVVVRWLESLHGSGLILAASVPLPRGCHYAPALAVAEVPEYATIAAEWTEPLDPAHPRSPFLNRRPLTPAEVAEIARLRRGLLKMPAVLFSLGVLVLAFMLAVNARSVPRHAWNDGTGFPLILLSFGGLALLRDYLRYRVLRRDEAAGMVLILRLPLPGAAETADAPELSPPTEVLPFSRMVWTQDGRPAPWRST